MLSQNLSLSPLQPCYVISGNEVLLHVEACDAIRAAAQQQGFTERHRFVMDGRSDWSEVFEATQALSLFGDKRLVDISLPSGKPGRQGGEALIKLNTQINAGLSHDTVFLIQLPTLDRATQNSQWAKQLSRTLKRQWITIPSVTRPKLPQWLQQRVQQQKQRLSPEALPWLADQIEGNLLAAHQEIQKMGLLYPEGELSLTQVQTAVLNVARYSIYDLRDAILNKNAKRVLAILQGLRGEGTALPLVLWVVSEEARKRPTQDPYHSTWSAAVRHAQQIDSMIKGLSCSGLLTDPWEEITRLCLRIALAA